MWSSEDNSQESFLSFHRVGPGDQTRVLSLGGRCLYPLRHLAGSLPVVCHSLALGSSGGMLFFLTRKVLVPQFRSLSKGSSPLNNPAREDFTFPWPEFRMLLCCLLLGRETSKKRAVPGDAGAQPPALPFLRLLKFRPSPRTFPKLPSPLPRVRVQGYNLLGMGEIVQKSMLGLSPKLV